MVIEYITDEEPIHEFFNLTYSSYFVIPRSILQSLPNDLQKQFVRVMEGIEDYYDGMACSPPPYGSYYVYLKDEDGDEIDDPFQDYERGRRRISKEYMKEVCN